MRPNVEEAVGNPRALRALAKDGHDVRLGERKIAPEEVADQLSEAAIRA
jgi:hypothetical protein